MRFRIVSHRFRNALTLASAGLVLTLPSYAQSATFAAPSATDTATTAIWHDTTIPADKQINANVKDGVLVVDGLVAKVQLNYEIHHAGYLYFFVPGVGTVVLSRANMYGSTRVKDAIHGSVLSFQTNGHSFELSNKSKLLPGKNTRSDVYVRLDSATLALDRYPMVGYGSTTRAPYVWPLSGPASKDTTAHFVTPPPLPPSILPRTVANPAGAQTVAVTVQQPFNP